MIPLRDQERNATFQGPGWIPSVAACREQVESLRRVAFSQRRGDVIATADMPNITPFGYLKTLTIITMRIF